MAPDGRVHASLDALLRFEESSLTPLERTLHRDLADLAKVPERRDESVDVTLVFRAQPVQANADRMRPDVAARVAAQMKQSRKILGRIAPLRAKGADGSVDLERLAEDEANLLTEEEQATLDRVARRVRALRREFRDRVVEGTAADAEKERARTLSIVKREFRARVLGHSVVLNTVSDVAGVGFRLSIGSSTILKNTARRCGVTEEHGFDVEGSDNVIERCRSFDSAGDGFFVDADRNTLTKCLAAGSLRDGFDIDSGNGNALERCIAKDCDGEGLDNGGVATDVTNSKLLRNRINLASDGTFGAFTGNHVTIDSAVAPEID